MRLKFILLGLAVLIASFAASLTVMNWLWPAAVEKPVLAKLPPLPPVTRNSEILTPIAISIAALRDGLDRAAPRNIGGKADNPVSQILQNADINWTVTRGPIAASGVQNALSLDTARRQADCTRLIVSGERDRTRQCAGQCSRQQCRQTARQRLDQATQCQRRDPRQCRHHRKT
jgi:hypothetical protein